MSKISSKESELPFSGINFFTHASSYLTNDNNNDSEDDSDGDNDTVLFNLVQKNSKFFSSLETSALYWSFFQIISYKLSGSVI